MDCSKCNIEMQYIKHEEEFKWIKYYYECPKCGDRKVKTDWLNDYPEPID